MPQDYNNHPFNVLVERATTAQKDGAIKGVLLHQGESDNGEEEWPNKLKAIYDRVLNELSLSRRSTTSCRELFSEAEGDDYAKHNDTITKVRSVIENSFVISSENWSS